MNKAPAERLSGAPFRPYLWVITEHKIGRPIFAVAIFTEDYFKLVPLPARITHLSPHLELKTIGYLVRRHCKRHNGSISCFGKILSYTYCRTLDEKWSLTADGELINYEAPPIKKGNYSLHLRGKPNRDIAVLLRSVSTKDESKT